MFEGSHSPFGFVWQIASVTGWSVNYILYGVNYQTLIMMLNDAPRHRRVRKGQPSGGHVESGSIPQPIDAEAASAEAEEILGFFQSKLT